MAVMIRARTDRREEPGIPSASETPVCSTNLAGGSLTYDAAMLATDSTFSITTIITTRIVAIVPACFSVLTYTQLRRNMKIK